MKRFSIASFLLLTALSPLAHAEEEHAHLDVSPYVEAGQLMTGGFDHDSGDVFDNIRVFGVELGEIPSQPTYAGDPGFNATASSGLGSGNQLGLRLNSPLTYWDGAGTEASFTSPMDGASIDWLFGAATFSITGDTNSVQDFMVGPITGSTGTLHFHLGSLLNDADSNPAEGIYVVEAQLIDSAGHTPSDPFYFVYNFGADEEAHELAIETIEASLVPEPASLALLALGGAGIVTRRRTRK